MSRYLISIRNYMAGFSLAVMGAGIKIWIVFHDLNDLEAHIGVCV